MNAFFTELGRTVLTRWQARNFSLADFPEIARAALDERPPAAEVDVAALMRDFLLDDEQPFQTRSPFGEPELVVYDHPRFYIQVLFWLEGAMEIHQHQFSGAFHVLAGSSLHSRFDFEDARAITAHFRVGRLELRETQLLETGRTAPIVSGAGCIHSLFHLDTPSLTVVVRTHHDPGTGPQFTYLPPHVAVDPFYNDALTTRRKQLLDVMERMEDPAYPEMVAGMLATLDFERGFFVLQNAMGYLRELGQWDEAWEIFCGRHGELAEYVASTLEEIVWRDGPLGLRASVTAEEHRFFLALLLNVPRRAELLAVVEQRFPGEAVETVLRWARELSEASSVATWILDAEFPLEVEVAPKKQLKTFLAALRYFLDGQSDGVKLTPAAREFFRQSFARSSLRALVS